MPGPHPATAAVRSAVRASLADLRRGGLVLVGCSGGADSLALAAAARFAAPGLGLRAGSIVVDHRLQAASGAVAATAADTCRGLGLDPVQVREVVVDTTASGPQSDARRARFAALDSAAEALGADAVLLGHTRDDQAEQVLLGLVRGSGARSLSGMPRVRGRYRRPLLGLTRAQTRASCTAQGLSWWDDPTNTDPAYARVRARAALGELERDLGPGVAAALARTAEQLREDADHLDALAATEVAALGPGPWPVAALGKIPRAVRTRVWRRLLRASGSPGGQLGSRHTDACDALLTRWHGQGPIDVPGRLRVRRRGGLIAVEQTPG